MAERKLTRADFVAWGKMSGGPEKMKRKGKEYFSRIGKLGAEARKKKKLLEKPN